MSLGLVSTENKTRMSKEEAKAGRDNKSEANISINLQHLEGWYYDTYTPSSPINSPWSVIKSECTYPLLSS